MDGRLLLWPHWDRDTLAAYLESLAGHELKKLKVAFRILTDFALSPLQILGEESQQDLDIRFWVLDSLVPFRRYSNFPNNLLPDVCDILAGYERSLSDSEAWRMANFHSLSKEQDVWKQVQVETSLRQLRDIFSTTLKDESIESPKTLSCSAPTVPTTPFGSLSVDTWSY